MAQTTDQLHKQCKEEQEYPACIADLLMTFDMEDVRPGAIPGIIKKHLLENGFD